MSHRVNPLAAPGSRRLSVARALAAALCLLPCADAVAQATDRARLAHVVDSLLAPSRDDEPGCAVGVADHGTVVLERAYGLANLEQRLANTPSTIFESGSLAKQFTAAAVLLLVQDGTLSLDDDVRRWLPEVPNFGTPITLRHLLSHTSGLREQWSLLAIAGNPPGSQVHTLATILDLVSRQRALNFTPGAEFLYTNTGYSLLALVIERASGRSLAALSIERIFRPLGMAHTAWRDDYRRVVPGRARAYSRGGEAGWREDMPFTNVIGNGGLLTTATDLLRWNTFLDAPDALPGGHAIVSALQTSGHLTDGRPIPYGLGLVTSTFAGTQMISHDGSTAGYKTWLGRLPAVGVSVALLCNNGSDDPVTLGRTIARSAFDGRPDSSLVSVATERTADGDLSPYAGLARDPVSGWLLQTAVTGGRLVTRDAWPRALAPDGADRFRLPDERMMTERTVVYRRAGGSVREVLIIGGRDTMRLTPVAPPDTGIAAVRAYVGRYYSAELDLRVSIALRDGALVVRQPFGVERRLTPLFRDGFTTPLRGTTTFLFSRDRSGLVSGLGVWATGARDVRFVRE